MSLKDTVRWVRSEWGIVAKGHEMSTQERIRWLRQWVPFGVRTIAYGTLSLTLGPLTRDHAASLWAMRNWCRSTMKGLRLSAQAKGLEHIPSEGGYVYACNHQSLLDILVLGAVLPGDFKWAAKRSIMKVPFLGWHLQLAGHVPVDRKRGKYAASEAVERFEHVLNAGKSLLIFPEGTRSEDGVIKSFKSGGFYAAVRANRPVVPVALEGTYRLMGKHAVDTGQIADAHERHIRVQVGEPLCPLQQGDELSRVADLRRRAHRAILDMHAVLKEQSEHARTAAP